MLKSDFEKLKEIIIECYPQYRTLSSKSCMGTEYLDIRTESKEVTVEWEKDKGCRITCYFTSGGAYANLYCSGKEWLLDCDEAIRRTRVYLERI